ncbi:SDR family oxidoreductase [bacterium]|nr:SDR family oxidoreductase [bacterium]
MSSILITGANRGIGLELTRQYLTRGERVFAGTRTPETADHLRELDQNHPGHLTILPLEVTDMEQVQSARRLIEREAGSLDLLINNAGINENSRESEDPAKHGRLGSLSAPHMLHMFHVNSVAPLMIAQEMLPLLEKGNAPKIVSISSGLGSIQQSGAGFYSYGTSKTALNRLMRILSYDLRGKGITTVTMDPGWVQTDMGGASATISVDRSVSAMIPVIDRLSLEDTGRFLHWEKGEDIPW